MLHLWLVSFYRVTLTGSELTSTKALDILEVPRAACRTHRQAGQLCKLNRQRASGRAAAVDQDISFLCRRVIRQRQFKRLIQPLTNSRDSHAKRCGFFVTEI
jgi:hypothetical protein